MTPPARSNVVSSFTIIKGALVPESYAAFRGWDLNQSTSANLNELKRTNYIGAKSANWLRDVAKVINRRFDPECRDRTLVELAAGAFSIEEWKPLLLWHMTRDEFLLRDFLVTWLFPRYTGTTHRLHARDVLDYIASLSTKTVDVAPQWSESTSSRVAAALLKIATDFGLLRGSIAREFCTYRLPELSFMYLLHAMMDQLRNAGKVLDSTDWHMFLMTRQDVEAELLRLHQFRKLHFESAGSLAQLKLPCVSLADYTKRLVA